MEENTAYTTAENIRIEALLKSLHDNRMIPQIITKDDGTETYKIYKKQDEIPYTIDDEDENVLKSGFGKVLGFFGRGKDEGIKISRPSDLTGELQEVGEIHLRSNGEKNPFDSPIAEVIPAEGLSKGLNEVMLDQATKPAMDVPFAPSFSNDEKTYIRDFFSEAVLSGRQILLEDSDGQITNFKNLRSEYILTSMLDSTQKVIIADESGHRIGSLNLVPQGIKGKAQEVFQDIEDADVFYNGTIERMIEESMEDIEDRRKREARGREAEEGDVNKEEVQAERAVANSTALAGFDDNDNDEIKEAVKRNSAQNVEEEAEEAGEKFDEIEKELGVPESESYEENPEDSDDKKEELPSFGDLLKG